MQPQQPSSPPTRSTFGRIASRRVWAAYVGTLIVGIGLPMADAFARHTPDSHPLQTDRLVLRIVSMAAIAANFAIVGIVVARAAREAARRRDGLCPACGYDLRAATGRCPECGWTPPPRGRAAGSESPINETSRP